VIVEKTIKSPDTTEKIDLKVEEIKVNKNKIFYLIGEPYYIEGVKYVPEENYSYEEIGLATFYDKELHNKRTANNDLNKVTELLGRHKTLPLPSIVKITNLENGLSLTIKIIDRHDDNTSIIQVSRKVAQLLRFYKNKITKTKVEILPDPSRQWKNVTMSINDKDFNNTVESAPTEIVSISNIDEDLNTAEDQNEDINIEQPIELGFEEVDDLDLYLHVNNFKNYQEIKNIVNEINLSDKYTSENIGNFYKLIVGPIDNKTADKLLSTFISKGYKESKLILN
jgi:rare lipoprotein A